MAYDPVEPSAAEQALAAYDSFVEVGVAPFQQAHANAVGLLDAVRPQLDGLRPEMLTYDEAAGLDEKLAAASLALKALQMRLRIYRKIHLEVQQEIKGIYREE